MTFRTFLALIMLLIIALFGVQNRDPVVFHFLTYEVSAPSAIAVIIAYVAGAFSGALLSWREQRRVRKHQQQITRATVATPASAPSVSAPPPSVSAPPPSVSAPPPAPVPVVSAVPEKKPVTKPEKKKRSWW